MTNKELILKLQQLKQIKPSQDWASSVKMNIFEVGTFVEKPAFQWNLASILALFNQKKLAYAFAIFLFVFLGGISFIKYGFLQTGNIKVANQATANLAAQA